MRNSVKPHNIFETGQRSVNSYPANAPILYPLKTPKNQSFSSFFREYDMETLIRNGLRKYGPSSTRFIPLQKQPAEVFYQETCSQKFRKIHLCQGLFFNKVDLEPVILYKIKLSFIIQVLLLEFCKNFNSKHTLNK